MKFICYRKIIERVNWKVSILISLYEIDIIQIIQVCEATLAQ